MSVRRFSEYEKTTVFSINNFYGEAVVAESFNTPNVDVVPILAEFRLDRPDPSGSRHLTTDPGFKKILASGRDVVPSGLGPLDFAVTNISEGSGISCTRCAIFRINQFDCDTTRVTDMKVWAADLSDFLVPESFEIIFDTRRTDAYPSGFEFDVSTLLNQSLHLPRSLPDLQNLKRQDGGFTIHGSGDADVSEYMLFAVAASGTLPLGEYVGDPDGFQIRVTYDIDNIPLVD